MRYSTGLNKSFILNTVYNNETYCKELCAFNNNCMGMFIHDVNNIDECNMLSDLGQGVYSELHNSSSLRKIKYPRNNNNNHKVRSINLEVYEDMAYKQFEKIIIEANKKWNLIDSLIIHRHGKLNVNNKIVLVASFSEHRRDSFESCNFIMDYLKKDAPFWKNEFYDKSNEWLENFN